MKIANLVVPEAWVRAGLSAMVGEFCADDVRQALRTAGVPDTRIGRSERVFSWALSRNLLAAERAKGHIRFDATHGLWVRL